MRFKIQYHSKNVIDLEPPEIEIDVLKDLTSNISNIDFDKES